MAEDMFEQLLRRTREDYDSLGIPVAEGEVAVEEMMLPMPDGVGLKTYIFHMEQDDLHRKDRMWPVILQRSPYFHAMDSYRIHGAELARRGFVYIVQCCRGTGESEGVWEPNVNERQDGLCTVNWLADQAWVKNIGYWGDSYLALTGWCMADTVPEKVKGMYLGVYGTDRFTSAYCKGLFRHDVLTSWAMENAGRPVEADYLESCRFRPHNRVDEALWGGELAWYRDWIRSVKEDDPYWQEGFWQLLRDIPKKVKIPLLIREGWYDHHLGSALKSFETLNDEVKAKCTLQIGSWNHFSMNCLEWDDPKNLQNSEVESMVGWFWQLLVEEQVPKKKIHIYIIGADKWIEAEEWPVRPDHIKTWTLSSKQKTDKAIVYGLAELNDKLNDNRKGESATECVNSSGDTRKKVYVDRKNSGEETAGKVEYIYDPDNPVPSLGGESMLKTMEHVGSMLQPEAGWREDVISFVSEQVKEDFVIGGKIRVYLTVASDCEDSAFTAKLMEVRENGESVNIRSSITTIAADRSDGAYEPGTRTEVCIEMWDIAWLVKAGSRMRLDISSSDFPQYAVHTNYPGIWSEQEKCRVAHQTIFCDGNSRLEIPVLGKDEKIF